MTRSHGGEADDNLSWRMASSTLLFVKITLNLEVSNNLVDVVGLAASGPAICVSY